MVAELYLIDSLKIGNGDFASGDDYGLEIQKVLYEYQKADVIDKNEPMPEFDYEYNINAQNLNDGIQTLTDNESNKKLFIRRDVTYGCAAARKGYVVIVTATDPLYNPKEGLKSSSFPDDINNTKTNSL